MVVMLRKVVDLVALIELMVEMVMLMLMIVMITMLRILKAVAFMVEILLDFHRVINNNKMFSQSFLFLLYYFVGVQLIPSNWRARNLVTSQAKVDAECVLAINSGSWKKRKCHRKEGIVCQREGLSECEHTRFVS